MKILLTFVCAMLLCLPGAVDAKKPPKPPPVVCADGISHPAGYVCPPPPDAYVWTKVGNVSGITGSYCVPMPQGGQQVVIYCNAIDGLLYRYVGDWTRVASPSMVLHIPDPRFDWIRTLGVCRGASGRVYAIVYAGDDYPTQGGYSPYAITSDDNGFTWSAPKVLELPQAVLKWLRAKVLIGPVSPFGFNQSSAMNLLCDESRTDGYVLQFWMDIPAGLMNVHCGAMFVGCASDGINVWPIPGEVPQFVSAAVDARGHVHMLGGPYTGYDTRPIRHVVLCHGALPARVIEMASDVGAGTLKGGVMAVDSLGTMHVLATGGHWTLQTTTDPCT